MAVDQITAPYPTHGGKQHPIDVHGTIQHLIPVLGVPSEGVGIHGIFRIPPDIRAIPAILGIVRILDHVALPGIQDIPPGAMLRVLDEGLGGSERALKFTNLCKNGVLLLVASFQEKLKGSLILILPDGLIEDMILRVVEIDAAEAMLRPVAVLKQAGIGAVDATVAEEESEGIIHIRAFIAERGIIHVSAIHDVFGKLQPVGIEGILIVARFHDQITVLIVGGDVRVFAIRGIEIDDGQLRDLIHELFDLREERPGEIEIPSVCLRIPFIGPPVIPIEHLERLIRGIHSDDLLPGSIARTPVELALIPPREPSALPAGWAECGCGNLIFHCVEDRRDILQESDVLIGDVESSPAESAALRFDDPFVIHA